jgi:hypothetical protein
MRRWGKKLVWTAVCVMVLLGWNSVRAEAAFDDRYDDGTLQQLWEDYEMPKTEYPLGKWITYLSWKQDAKAKKRQKIRNFTAKRTDENTVTLKWKQRMGDWYYEVYDTKSDGSVKIERTAYIYYDLVYVIEQLNYDTGKYEEVARTQNHELTLYQADTGQKLRFRIYAVKGAGVITDRMDTVYFDYWDMREKGEYFEDAGCAYTNIEGTQPEAFEESFAPRDVVGERTQQTISWHMDIALYVTIDGSDCNDFINPQDNDGADTRHATEYILERYTKEDGWQQVLSYKEAKKKKDFECVETYMEDGKYWFKLERLSTKREAEKVYAYRIRGYNELYDLYGEYSNVFHGMFLAAPVKTCAKQITGDDAVTLSWTIFDRREKNIDGYAVIYSTFNKFDTYQIKYVKKEKRSCTVDGLKKGEKYYFYIFNYKVIDGQKIFSDTSFRMSAQM